MFGGRSPPERAYQVRVDALVEPLPGDRVLCLRELLDSLIPQPLRQATSPRGIVLQERPLRPVPVDRGEPIRHWHGFSAKRQQFVTLLHVLPPTLHPQSRKG
jgi:hypothetical protein